MDIVLEAFDTYLFDPIYAKVLPASSTSFVTQYVKHAASATFSSMREMGTQPPQQSVFTPASQIVNFIPSHWAFASALPRDNMYRQFLSLFTITW